MPRFIHRVVALSIVNITKGAPEREKFGYCIIEICIQVGNCFVVLPVLRIVEQYWVNKVKAIA